MSTPEPFPYRKLNYPVNNLAQDFDATEKDQVRQNIGIPSSVNKAGKVLKVDDNTGNLAWADDSQGVGTVTDVKVNGSSVVSDGVAEVTVPTKTSDLQNDSGFLTSQAQADWLEQHQSDPSYIKNKPSIPSKTSDLQNDSGFITASEVPDPLPASTIADEGKVLTVDSNGDPAWQPSQGGGGTVTDVTVNGTSVVSGGVASITVPTKTSDLTNDSGFITSSDIPAQVQSDWNESDSNDPAYIKNKPSIPAAQVNSDWNASSGVAEILNKPSIPSKTSDLQNDSGFITSSGVPGAQEQADWNESNASDPAYIKNKPSIPAAQVNSDWNASSGVAEILNKPSIPSKTSDLQNDNGFITSSDVPGSQEQSDWNESNSSEPAYIKNKPTINNVPVVGSSDDGKVLTASYSGGVGSYSWQTGGGGGSGNIEIINYSDLTTRFTSYEDLYTEAVTNGKTIAIYNDSGSVYAGYYYLSTIDSSAAQFTCVHSGANHFTSTDQFVIYISKTVSGTPNYTYYISGVGISYAFNPPEWLANRSMVVNAYIPVGSYYSGQLMLASDPSSATKIYKCISAYTQSAANVTFNSDTTHWQQIYLEDLLNDLYNGNSVTLAQGNGISLSQSNGILTISGVELPVYSSSDAGKVLQVQANGTLAWVTLS